MSSAFVFDAYGTLFDVHSVQARCEALWPGRGAQLSQLWRARQLEYTWQRSLMRRYAPFSQLTREALEYACEFLGLKLSKEQADSLMARYLRLDTFTDVPGTLRALGQHRLAILSNGSPDLLGPVVAHSGLRFDAVLSVDEVKVYKPDPAVYDLAVRKLDTGTQDIVFVSSNGWDAQGAKSFGFRVYWINRAGAPLDRLGFAPDRILGSFGEILR